MRNICAVQTPMPFTCVRCPMTSSSESLGSRPKACLKFSIIYSDMRGVKARLVPVSFYLNNTEIHWHHKRRECYERYRTVFSINSFVPAYGSPGLSNSIEKYPL